MKFKSLLRVLALLGAIVIDAQSAQAGRLAEVRFARPDLGVPLNCVWSKGRVDLGEDVFRTNNLSVLLMIPGCEFGCEVFRGTLPPGVEIQLGGGRKGRLENPAARVSGGLALFKFRSAGKRLFFEVEACADFDNSLSTLMTVVAEFDIEVPQSFYAKGMWLPRYRRGQLYSWQLTHRAAKEE